MQTTLAMTSLGMLGPVELKAENIDKLIRGKSPGNFALGYIEGKAFIVKYVGRSDTDINHQLKNWIGQYPHFKWSYAASAKEAFNKECRNYHDFGGNELLDNTSHPVRINGHYHCCEICGH